MTRPASFCRPPSTLKRFGTSSLFFVKLTTSAAHLLSLREPTGCVTFALPLGFWQQTGSVLMAQANATNFSSLSIKCQAVNLLLSWECQEHLCCNIGTIQATPPHSKWNKNNSEAINLTYRVFFPSTVECETFWLAVFVFIYSLRVVIRVTFWQDVQSFI